MAEFAAQPDDLKNDLPAKIKKLQGPILVLGGSGFVGANLFKTIRAARDDVFATATRLPAWRLEDVPRQNVRVLDLLVDSNLDGLLDEIKPRTVFNCVAYGGYSFESDPGLIYRTNFTLTTRLLPRLANPHTACYLHAGSSSEYGDSAAAPLETETPRPNSDYAVSKAASAGLIFFYGKKKNLSCANLRLYSVYGPLEDSSRLVPNLIQAGLQNKFPDFVHPEISRDFLYADDASEAFIDAALNLQPADFGESFNIGTGEKTTIKQVAALAGDLFKISTPPAYTMPDRAWDVADWYANPQRARDRLGWSAKTKLRDGLEKSVAWFQSIPDKTKYFQSSKRFGLDTRHSVSAIIACYRDAQAIPIMYQRLTEVFNRLRVDYEIIFVNDCSPDDAEEVIRKLSANDRRVIGISHSRNFGSQAAFRSGMAFATKNSCVLLDGDLQDPPEIIEQFVPKWREGFDVIYGRRVKREAPWFMQISYKLFYRLFDKFSYMKIPHDAGDFSLMDKRVVASLLKFPERDLFLRGVRAFAGFRQTGVDYVRPERMFGRTTNSVMKNLGWAKKGILSFSNVPLNMLSTAGVILFLITMVVVVIHVILKLMFPKIAAQGITTVLITVMFFGSVNLFALSLLGEYIAKIFEEVKRRPHFIRRSVIRDGELRPAEIPNPNTTEVSE